MGSGSHSASDVALFFANGIENQAGQAEVCIYEWYIDILPLAFAPAVAAGDHDGWHLGWRILWAIKDCGHTRTGFAGPDPFFDDDTVAFDLAA